MISITTVLKNPLTLNCYLLTDSLTYQVKSKDVYEEFLNHKHVFDFRNYPKDSKFFDLTNKNVIGKMKDEKRRKINDEFVGLKSKMYSIKNIVGKESNTGKGVNIATEFNEFKAKSINMELRKLTKYHCLFSMINDTFKTIALTRSHIFIKT